MLKNILFSLYKGEKWANAFETPEDKGLQDSIIWGFTWGF